MFDLEIIKRMNDNAVKKWYETERQKINRLKRELAELESRVESYDLKATEEEIHEP